MLSTDHILTENYGVGAPLEPIHPYRKNVGNLIVEPSPEWLAIIDDICVKHRVHRSDVLAGWRGDAACACRREIWATMRGRFGTSLPKIGMMTGGFHHTTVLNGINKYNQQHAAQQQAA